MSKSQNNVKETVKALPIVEVQRAGDWRIPVTLKDGSTIYCVQVNKTKEQKADKLQEKYRNAGVQVYTYKGKKDGDVYLIEPKDLFKRESRNGNVKTLKSEFKGKSLSTMSKADKLKLETLLASL